MKKFVIATNEEYALLGNYFTEVMDEETANEKLEQVRMADPDAELLEVVVKKGGKYI